MYLCFYWKNIYLLQWEVCVLSSSLLLNGSALLEIYYLLSNRKAASTLLVPFTCFRMYVYQSQKKTKIKCVSGLFCSDICWPDFSTAHCLGRWYITRGSYLYGRHALASVLQFWLYNLASVPSRKRVRMRRTSYRRFVIGSCVLDSWLCFIRYCPFNPAISQVPHSSPQTRCCPSAGSHRSVLIRLCLNCVWTPIRASAPPPMKP